MDRLLEEPLLIIVVGFVTIAILGGFWLQTGHKPLVYALALAVTLTCGLVLLERVVETDREQIEATLQQIARDLERNDLDALLRYLHSSETKIRVRAVSELPKYEFHRVSIKQNLEILSEADREPPRAVATFNVVVVLSDQSGLLKERPIPRYVSVIFEKEQDTWRVIDYSHQEPQVGFQRKR